MNLSSTITLKDNFTATLNRAYETTQKFSKAQQEASNALKRLGSTKASPTIEARDEASGKIRDITSKIKVLGHMTVSPVVKVIDQTTAPLRKVTSSLLNIKNMLVGSAIVTGAGGLLKYSMQLASEQEQANIGFETMLGSAKKAKDMMQQLTAFAIKTPFEMPQLRDAANKLLAFGFSAKSIIPTLTAVGDAASGLGKGAEGVDQIVTALGQMRAKAKVSADEMLQLTEAGVPAWDLLAKGMHKSTAEVMDLSQKGLIPANKALDILISGMESRFPNMMAKQSRTIGGLVSTLKDYFNLNIFTSFGQGISDSIEPALQRLTDKMTGNRKELAKVQGMFHQLGGEVGNWVVKNFEALYGWFEKLANNKDFQKLSTGDKIIYILNQGLNAVDKWINGPGGKRVQGLFAKIGEIAAKAWINAIGTTFKNSIKDLFKGDFGGAAGNAALFYMLGGGGLLGAGLKIGGGLLGKGLGMAGNIGKGILTNPNVIGYDLTKVVVGESEAVTKSAKAAETAANTATKGAGAVTKTAKAAETAANTASKGAGAVSKTAKAAETAAKGAGKAAETVSKSASLLSKLGKVGEMLGSVSKVLGKIALPIAIATDIYDFATSKDKVKTGAKIGGGWAGAAAGGALGTAILPGIGTAIGGILGYFGGSWGAGKLVDWIRSLLGKSKAPSPTTKTASKGGASSLNVAQYLNDNLYKPFRDIVNRAGSWGRNLMINFMHGRDSAGMNMNAWLNTKVYIPFRNIVDRARLWGRNLLINFMSGRTSAGMSMAGWLNTMVYIPFRDIVTRATSWGRNLMINFMNGRDAAGMNMTAWLNTKVYIPFRDIVVRATLWGSNLIGNFINGMQSRSGNLTAEVNTLTNRVVQQFKKNLGIASPSKVTFAIGQYLMQGLINGMSSVDVQKFTKKQMNGLIGAMGGRGSSKFVPGWLSMALMATGTPLSWLPGLMRLVQAESGGNPFAVNPISVGGEHATGLLQTLPSTFARYAIRGLGGILNPIANAAAAIRYIKARYGSIYNTPLFRGGPYKGYAVGLPYVPSNNFPALLHEGERVLTAQENRQYSGARPNITINIPKLADRIDAGDPADVDRLLFKIEQKLLRVAANMPATV